MPLVDAKNMKRLRKNPRFINVPYKPTNAKRLKRQQL